ncbi:hypothetical protein SAY87_013920 [Trapa incisa]|uniref:PWI domain-containing protein n=1 Tax=Trapa incisa TaxID=236973 RepID=A0AAN7KJK5_9MYRT|nr:hypothetical protein SAY87_013920 [Trapa incisa]
MSGGFFRGTSADQDTRFSNKQAKLMKTLKFAPELEHLVDMTKIKMDIMKPWIATRVTELIGFEDEVLINFIYGLLDRKEVNGKEVQISLTGFMEKNTSKFMKELWNLLLSAQKNASGVPQQFLDDRDEETRKKKAETDRMAGEIQRKWDKENREQEHEKLKTMGYQDQAKHANADVHMRSEQLASKASDARSDDRQGTGKGNGVRERDRRPHSRSISKSSSSSRSHSDERRHRSRSMSQSPRARDRIIPSDMVHLSRKRSLTPHRRYPPRESRSPPRRRSYYRRRSRSPSISPMRRSMHSPIKRRSRTPIRRRSVTPVRRRRSPSPVWRRSPSPKRWRSPSPRRRPSSPRRRRSPSPRRKRSPSPRRQRSPSPRRQISPISCSSPSPMEHESPSLVGHRSSSQIGHRSSSPLRNRSPLAVQHRSPSPMKHKSKSRLQSPVRPQSPSPLLDRSISPVKHRSSSPLRKQEHRSRSSQRQRPPPEAQGRSPVKRLRRSVTPSQGSSNESSPRIGRHSFSPVRRSPAIRKPTDQTSKGKMRLRESPVRQPKNHRDDRRSSSSDGSPIRQVRNQVARGSHLDSSRRSGKHRQYDDSSDSSEQHEENYISWESHSGKGVHSEISDWVSAPLDKPSLQAQKEKFVSMEGKNSEDKNHARTDISRNEDMPSNVLEPLGTVNNQHGGSSEESEKHKYKQKERRKHNRQVRYEMYSSSESYDSEAEGRKEAKRRRKEEKKLRKEERRRRREERHCRKEERRAEKLKVKRCGNISSTLDDENHLSNVNSSDGEQGNRKKSCGSLNEEPEKEQKKLENELRMKALESFKAKKGAK